MGDKNVNDAARATHSAPTPPSFFNTAYFPSLDFSSLLNDQNNHVAHDLHLRTQRHNNSAIGGEVRDLELTPEPQKEDCKFCESTFFTHTLDGSLAAELSFKCSVKTQNVENHAKPNRFCITADMGAPVGMTYSASINFHVFSKDPLPKPQSNCFRLMLNLKQ